MRHIWSVLNVPLMWAASSGDAECPVLLWLAHAGEQVEALSQSDGIWNGRQAVLDGWSAKATAMRSWGVRSREDLSEWILKQGLMGKSFQWPRTRENFVHRSDDGFQSSLIASNVRPVNSCHRHHHLHRQFLDRRNPESPPRHSPKAHGHCWTMSI